MNWGIRNSQDAARAVFPRSSTRQGGHHSLQGEQWMYSKTLHIAGLPRPLGTCLQSAVIITYPFPTACLHPDRRSHTPNLFCLKLRPLHRFALEGELAPGDPAAREHGLDVVYVAVIVLCTRRALP